MDIFESLENLNVSEECFDDIVSIVEDIINERDIFTRPKAAKNSIEGRQRKYYQALDNYQDSLRRDEKDKKLYKTDINDTEVKDGVVHHVRGYADDDNIHREYTPASGEVQKAYKDYKKAANRLGHAKSVASGTVNNAIKAEEEHQKKVKSIKEDYESFKNQKEEENTSQSYSDLANVNKSIRRNKTRKLKAAFKEHGKARKEEFNSRGKRWAEQWVDITREEQALDKLKKAREDERDAQEEVDKAMRRADKAKELEERNK